MTPPDPIVARVLEEVANGLQSAISLTEHLERLTAAAARDLTGITLSLRRVTEALASLRKGQAR